MMTQGKTALTILIATLALCLAGTAGASNPNDPGEGNNGNNDPYIPSPLMTCLANAIETGSNVEACRALVPMQNKTANSPVMKCLATAIENGADPEFCERFKEPEPGPIADRAAGAVMCLAHLVMAGMKPQKCKGYIDNYLSHADYDMGNFDPDDTYEERGEFLAHCKKCSRSDIFKVQARFGRVPPTTAL